MRQLLAIIAALFSVSAPYVWTVGQNGVASVNRNICELIKRHISTLTTNCEIDNWLLYAWFAAIFASILYLLWITIQYFRKPTNRKCIHTGASSVRNYVRAAPEETKQPFKIRLGSGPPYEFVAPVGVNMARTISIKIENNTNNFVPNGRLVVDNLDPPCNGNSKWLLSESVVIAAGSHTIVNVAGYSEGTSSYPPGSFITLIAPAQNGTFAESYPLLPVRSHKFTLRFSTAEGLGDEIYCRLYVDKNHRLYLENWGTSKNLAEEIVI